MPASNAIRTVFEWSLCLLLIPAGLMSLEWLTVGVTFGFNLWRPGRSFAILTWVAVVIFPAFVAWALAKSFKAKSLGITAVLSLAAWTFAGFCLWDLYVGRLGW